MQKEKISCSLIKKETIEVEISSQKRPLYIFPEDITKMYIKKERTTDYRIENTYQIYYNKPSDTNSYYDTEKVVIVDRETFDKIQDIWQVSCLHKKVEEDSKNWKLKSKR